MAFQSLIKLSTIVTDVLAIIGLFIIIFSPLIFSSIQRKILNQRLHTKIDGEKLFEKLKYDLKVPVLTGINKKRLYTDQHYAKTIFRGAMEYNQRELVWFFNELGAKKFIHSTILKKAWLHFLIWLITILVMFGGSNLDFVTWLLQVNLLSSYSGIVSIFVLVFFAEVLSALVKIFEFKKVKTVINDEVRQINLTKKGKVWKDYKIIFWISCAFQGFGFILIFINFFYK